MSRSIVPGHRLKMCCMAADGAAAVHRAGRRGSCRVLTGIPINRSSMPSACRGFSLLLLSLHPLLHSAAAPVVALRSSPRDRAHAAVGKMSENGWVVVCPTSVCVRYICRTGVAQSSILMLSSAILEGYELLVYTTTGALGTGFRYS